MLRRTLSKEKPPRSLDDNILATQWQHGPPQLLGET